MHRPAPSVILEHVDGEAVLLDLDNDLYFGLNSTGLIVWNHFADGGDLDGAVDALCAEYDVEREAARADVSELVATLVGKRLLFVEP